MRMRTIDEAYSYIKQEDPDTALTKNALRRLVTDGTIPSVRVGLKYLIALENVEAYLTGSLNVPVMWQDADNDSGKIRRIAI